MKEQDIIKKTIKDNINEKDFTIAKLLNDNYKEFAIKNTNSLRKRVGEVRREFGLYSNKDIKTKTVKIKDSDIEINKDEWLKKESEIRNIKEKIGEKEKIIKLLNSELDNKIKYVDALLENIPKLPIVKDIPKYTFDKKKIDEDVVLMLSDIHAGEVVDVYEMEGMGEYNFDIFAKRLYFLCEKLVEVVENQRNISNIKKLWIDGLGDIVQGEIHQRETNEHSIIPVVLNTSLVISQSIAMLSRHFSEIEFTGLVGNHGRLEKKPPSKRIYNNWDYLVYQQIALFLKDYKNIKFNIPQSPSCIVNRMGYKFLLTHGDSIKGGFAGIPVYGLIRNFSNQQDIRRTRGGFDYMELGHFHEDIKAKDGKLIVNGSMVGNSQYGLHKLHVVSTPMQKVFGINKKYGISWERNMKLTDAEHHNFKYSFNNNTVYKDLLE